MGRIVTLALKDLRLLSRNWFALFWIFAFPLGLAMLIGSVFGGPGERAALKVAVIDDDQTDGSRAFLARLEKSDALQVLNLSREQAQEAVRKGSAVAFVVVPKGFGAANLFGPDAPRLPRPRRWFGQRVCVVADADRRRGPCRSRQPIRAQQVRAGASGASRHR